MAKFFLKPNKIIFLRGAQEEMFLKVLQLQTAPNPHDIVNWMFEHGVDATIESYGFNKKSLIEISTQGTLAITKWTARLNETLSLEPGHKQYFANLKHAAYGETKRILFLNRGVDISRPLSAQNDCVWWGYQNFSSLDKPYNSFIRIIRGYKSSKKNDLEDSKNNIVCSLFQQPLTNSKIIAGIFNDSGEILDIFESN
jgi:serine/threonine protein phosphatase 1